MPPARKSNKLTRKELQQLKEYGQLDPLGATGAENDLDEMISKAINRRGQGRFSGVIPLDDEKPRGRGRGRGHGRANREGIDRHSSSRTKHALAPNKKQKKEKTDAYTKLLKTLSASTKSASNQNAIVSDEEDEPSTDEDVEMHENQETVPLSDDDMADGDGTLSGSQTEEQVYEIDEVEQDADESGDDEDNSSNEDDGDTEDLVDAKASGDFEKIEVCEEHDYMGSHFAEDNSALMHEKLAAVTQKGYKQVPIDDPKLGTAILFDVANGGIKPANPKPLKQKLVKPFQKLNKKDGFTDFQRGLFNWMDQYRDVVYAGRNFEKDDEITTTYTLHAMNHVLKSRDREKKNNTKLSKAHASGTDAGELRDRGFTRPRVLIITPFRNSAHKIVEKILKLSSADQEINLARLNKEYGPGENDEAESKAHKRKPVDFQQTFAGNIDDSFRIGIKFQFNTVKLYADFYRADIIVASPIGLRMTTGAQKGDRKDFDFLSSIEMVIVDQCDVLLMQNWDHVSHIFECMNKTPKKDHGCDFSRVNNWFLEGMSEYRRQTILISEYMTPEIQAIFNNNCRSIEGKVRFKPVMQGAIADVVAQVSQIFKKLTVKRLVTAADDRFAHFTQNVLPELQRSAVNDKHTLIFVSSYYDFVRIRNYLRDKGFSFAAISEYSTRTEAMHARLDFYNGDIQFILYSERAHFYHRYPIKGIHHMVFYSLPDHPLYYSELVNLMLTSNDETASSAQLSCTAFYTKYDQLKVERIVGTRLTPQLISGDRSQYTFA
ncbi:rRNA-binding ribosome biosynthesis protein utp25 [Coemansia sp. RSA 1722]|nr:rRNA-binding ribosome biosynthesis protein utp25 [Coemansia sp. RSA 485]KAJ2601864.1 rRNA-binding ribosome biosynthesis protein utp25 [Coemansia sp. RSA 1722]KAJ2637767.1 rRNA-binding ribosome biosynthesis protein utp25 [Coemansia sp. RSA 1286]